MHRLYVLDRIAITERNNQLGIKIMVIYKTREEALTAAINNFGVLAVETKTVNIIKIGPMIAKYLKCEEGYTIESIE